MAGELQYRCPSVGIGIRIGRDGKLRELRQGSIAKSGIDPSLALAGVSKQRAG